MFSPSTLLPLEDHNSTSNSHPQKSLSHLHLPLPSSPSLSISTLKLHKMGRGPKKQEPQIISTPQRFPSLPQRQISIPPHKTSMSKVPKHHSSSIQNHHLHHKQSKQKPNNKMVFQRDSPRSLSFCNLPNSKGQEIPRDISFEGRPTTPAKEFEFFVSFNGLQSETCFAEEIFSNGKLRPFKSSIPKNTTATTQGQVWNPPKDFFNAKKIRAIRHGCSAEYRRLEKDTSHTKSQTQKSKRISNGMWFRSWLMFGIPAEMEISDIHSRLKRRSPATFMQQTAAGGEEEGKRKWKLLNAMSCRSVADVGTPLEFRVARVRVG